jgi:hypothetical protein
MHEDESAGKRRMGELCTFRKVSRIIVSSARRCGARFRKFIRRWLTPVRLSIGKVPFGPAAVGDEGGVQEVGIRKRRNKLNGAGI